MSLPRTTDVLVIGGGVVGCAIARELAGIGRRVLVVDRGALGGEASSAAAGVLAVASGGDDGARLALRRASAAMFPELARALRDETGVDVGLERRGVLELAFSDDAARGLGERIARRRAEGFRVDPVTARDLRALEPAASPDARVGALFPDDAVVVAERLVVACAESARRRGAMLVPGAPATGVERRGDRVARVRVAGEWVVAGHIVVAAGAWSSSLAGLDAGVRVVPVRGQMLALRPSRAIAHVLTAGDAFLVPRSDGEVWAGATFEEVGFEKAVTPDGLRALAAHVGRLAPEALAAPIARAWCGLRPMAPSGLAIGWAPALANVVVATGHHRNGILLAPATAAAVAAYVAGRAPDPAIAAFGPTA